MTLVYDGKTVLSDASFFLDAGDYLCILGENGSGKSTLVKALLSLKRPAAGEILFGKGIKPTDIGYLPQQFGVGRSFPATVFEVVLSGCLAKNGFKFFYTKEDKKRAFENMELLGISEIKEKNYGELSGGQQQRVLLARALCAADRILILDEPSNGLDPVVKKDMYSIIEELRLRRGISVVMVSHDISSAVKYATKILHLDRSVKFFGSSEEYRLSSEFHSFLEGGRSNE